MGKRACNALTTAGLRCHAIVEQGAEHCPAGHLPDLIQVPQVRSTASESNRVKDQSRLPGNQVSGTEAKCDFDLWGDWTSIGQALVLIPLLVLSGICLMFSLLPLFLILWNVVPGHWLIPVATYYAAGLLFFVPPIENFMWDYIDRSSREPTREETQRLDPAWKDVMAKVGKGGKRKYRLRVTDTSQLNAYAAGGRQVAVTQGALQYLSDSELRGIVAHELGHHAGLHPVMGLAAHWIIKPIGWAEWVSIKLHNLSAFITRFARRAFVFWAAYALALLLLAVVFLLRGIVYITQIILLWFGRRAEYRADETAVRLGFGPGLLSSLHVFKAMEHQQGNTVHDTKVERMLYNTHPPTQKRIARVEAKLNG